VAHGETGERPFFNGLFALAEAGKIAIESQRTAVQQDVLQFIEID
jgi:hypothetical protein